MGNAMEKAGEPTEKREKLKEIEPLIELAKEGNKEALRELKEHDAVFVEEYLRDRYGDFGHMTEKMVIEMIAQKNLAVREGMRLKAEQLREELAGASSSGLEKLLIERIVACWLWACYADALAAANKNGSTWKTEEYAQKRQDKALRRFVQACRALAQVRRLMGGNIQVNIAEKQINVV